MSRKLIAVVISSVALIVTVLVAYAQPLFQQSFSNTAKEAAIPAQAVVQKQKGNRAKAEAFRNLARQQHALKLARQIGGERFQSTTPATLVVQGLLVTGSEQHSITISRRPHAKGEEVDVRFADKADAFSWNENSGARTSKGALNLTERTLVERLTFDSADQFILAQLRGAGYYVVARNVRPDDAPEDYSGPLWDVVRVDDREEDQQKRPLSSWRLYYINSATGLIDKVVSEVQGERIEAVFSNWTDRDGEKFPSSITWTSNGQTLMTLNLTTISFVQQ